MTTYQCDKCQKYTNDLDTAPCGTTNCSSFQPREIATVHYIYRNDENKLIIPCDPKNRVGIMASSTFAGVTCQKCVDAFASPQEEIVNPVRTSEAELSDPDTEEYLS